MAEVGVLNLTIKDNSEQAAAGLNRLADALSRVKDAVSSGLKLSTISAGIEKLAKVIDDEIHSSTISKISELGDALSKLQGIGTINIHIKNSGVEKVRTTMRQAEEAVQGIQSGMTETTQAMEGFTTAERSIHEVTSEYRDMQEAMSENVNKEAVPDLAEMDMSKLNLNDYVADPITAMKDRFMFMGDAARDCKTNVDAVIPSLRNYRDTVMGLESKKDIAGFSKKTGEDLIGGLKEASSEVKNTVTDTVQEAQAAVESTPVYKSLEEAAKAMGITVDEARQKVAATWQMLQSQSGETRVFTSIEEAAKSLGMTVDEVKAKLNETWQMVQNAGNVQGVMDGISDSVSDMTASTAGMELIPTEQFIEAYSHLDYLKGKLEDLTGEFDTKRRLGILNADEIDSYVTKIIHLREEIQKLQEAQANVASSSGKLGQFFSSLGQGMKNLDIPFANLFKSFARIAKYRMLRAVLKQITQGFKEGVENVYRYSQAVGTSFAPAMDSLSSTMAQFKNSLGAAVAPALQAIIPVLNSIANAAISVINVLNQLFALLGGQGSWTKAMPQTKEAFDGIKKAAGGAGGAVKEMLASFDELNVIASESGGGGGGGGSAVSDYADMFKEMFTFDQGIRDFVTWLKDNMESIKGIAIAIGAAIAGWKIAKAFYDILPWLSKLGALVATGAVIAITAQVTWLLTNRYLDTKDEGWLIADILTSAVGATIAGAIAKKFLGGQAAVYAASFTLAFSALAGITALLKRPDVSAFSKESLLTALVNALKVGGAAAILMKTVGGATLGTSLLGGSVAALATFGIVIGLKAALDPSIEMFSLESAIAAVTSAAMTGLGVAILAGNPVIGAGAAVAMFLAYIAIKACISTEHTQWGDIELTDEEVEKFVQTKMFRIDLDVDIQRINTTVEATAVNKSALESTISSLVGDLRIIKLGVATTQDYAQIQTDVNAVVEKAHEYATSQENLAKLTLQFTPKLVGENEEEQGEWYKKYTEGWETVDEWFAAKGKELGTLFVENEKGEIIASKPELIAEIMQQMAEVAQAGKDYKIKTELFLDFQVSLGDLTHQSFNDVKKKFEEYRGKVREAMENSLKEQIAGQSELVGKLGKIDPTSDAYKEAKAYLDWMIDNYDKALDDAVNEASAPGIDLFTEWLRGKYKPGQMTGKNWDFIDMINRGAEMSLEQLKEKYYNIFDESTFSSKDIDIMKLISFSGFEFFSEDLQKQLVQALGKSVDGITFMKDFLGLDISQIIALSGSDTMGSNLTLTLMATLDSVFGSEQLLESLKGSGIDIAAMIAAGMSSDDEAIRAAAEKWKKLIDGELGQVGEGDQKGGEKAGNSIFEKAKAAVEEKMSSVKEKISGMLDKLKVVLDSESVNSAAGSVGTAVENETKNLTVEATEESKTAMGTSVKEAVEVQVKKLDVGASATSKSAMASDVKSALEDKTKNITVGFNSDSFNSVARSLKSAIENTKIRPNIEASISINITVQGKVKLKAEIENGSVTSATAETLSFTSNSTRINAYAGGAYGIPTGSLFVAGEEGPEMVGVMNGQNAVANTDQIVAGISQGVENANGEQNALLREQNNLLRQLLSKGNTVRFGASAAFGRVAKQSLEMYGLVGG